ncbi:MAG: hypothetical protein ACXADB_00055 [Candidatus Hermodarchaeia archaeon]|jgi:hypothetical protein
MQKIYKIAERFRKILRLAVWGGLVGKDYIKQKPDGTLYVDNVQLDRDALNAMESWDDFVDMGVSRETVGRIALEYGGDPRNVDTWLENNSKPFGGEVEGKRSPFLGLSEEDKPQKPGGDRGKCIQKLKDAKRGRFGSVFAGMHVGPYWVSIQGGENYFSKPRKDLPNLTDYRALEMQIMNDRGGTVYPAVDDVLANMPHADYFETDTASYVPIEKVLDIMEYLDSQTHCGDFPEEEEEEESGDDF